LNSSAPILSILQAIGGLALLYLGGDALVRGASALALRLGISPLAVGLTIVAFGTSAPELVVSVDAALGGANDIAVGNVVGSNIANIALILGLSALVCPTTVHAKIVRLDAPLMILASLALIGALANGHVSRIEGALLALGLAGYAVFTFWEARRETKAVKREFASAAPSRPLPLIWSTVFVAGGLLMLVAGGHLLVTSAVRMATALGVSQATIGLTIVAIGTSLPELATSLIAAFKRQGDIAIGNIVGSNLFNILGILGATATLRPLALGAISAIDLTVMLALSATLLVLLHSRPALARTEGAVLLTSYVAYIAWLLAFAPR
jgi:cation:H+ antiporter